MQIFGILNDDVLQRYYLNQAKKCIAVNGKLVKIPLDFIEAAEVLLAHGYLPVVPEVYSPLTHVLGTYKVHIDIIHRELIELTEEEKAEAIINFRKELDSDIKNTCKFYLDQLTNEISVTKAISLEEDKKQMNAGNSSYFNRRAGARMTGAQFMESFLRPLVVAGEFHKDTVIGIESTLRYDLMNTPDEELVNFDAKSLWDELQDFQEPTVEEVPAQFWASLKAKLFMKVW